MTLLETEWWTMALPMEWWAEAEEESVLIGDHDDVGCIEMTTLQKESGEFDPDEVANIARSESVAGAELQPVQLGEFRGLTTAFAEEGAAIREWYLASGALLLFVTYSCDEDNAGLDDAAVNEILDTLMIGA